MLLHRDSDRRQPILAASLFEHVRVESFPQFFYSLLGLGHGFRLSPGRHIVSGLVAFESGLGATFGAVLDAKLQLQIQAVIGIDTCFLRMCLPTE